MGKVIVYLLGMVLLAFAWHKVWQKALATNDKKTLGGPLRLGLTVLAMFAGSVILAVMTVRSLISGEVGCSGKGGCPVDVHSVATSPNAYWFNVGFLAITATMLLWAVYLIARHWHAQRV
jgi:hypothetical protein